MPDLHDAAIMSRLASASMGQSQNLFGRGPTIENEDALFIHLLTNFISRPPQERVSLTETMRPVLLELLLESEKVKSDRNYYDSLISHSSSVHPSNASAMPRLLAGQTVTSHCDYDLLEGHRSDVASLARFSQRVDHATWNLFVAIDTKLDSKLWFKSDVSVRRSPRSGYSALARQCFSRWETTRELLAADWSIPVTVEPLYRTAFWSLCELTPADSQLKTLFELDRFRACRELIRHVDAYADQLALATDLAESITENETEATRNEDDDRRDAIQTALLEQAGERLTLTEASGRLGISRQALHKKIKSGSALGLMIGMTFVVPSAQFVTDDSGTRIVKHLKDVLSPFSDSGAGNWSALQYLVEPDPTLGGAIPLEQLKAGETAMVVAGARGYLGLDEG